MTLILAATQVKAGTRNTSMIFDSAVSGVPKDKCRIITRLPKGFVCNNGYIACANMGYTQITRILRHIVNWDECTVPQCSVQSLINKSEATKEDALTNEDAFSIELQAIVRWYERELKPELKNAFKKAEFGEIKNGKLDIGGEAVFIFKGHLFSTSPSFDIYNSDNNYTGLGTGCEPGMAAFDMGRRSNKPLEECLFQAAQIARTNKLVIQPPYHLIRFVNGKCAEYALLNEHGKRLPLSKKLEYGIELQYARLSP